MNLLAVSHCGWIHACFRVRSAAGQVVGVGAASAVSMWVMLPKEPVPYTLGKEAQTLLGEPQRRLLGDRKPSSLKTAHRHLCVFTLLKGCSIGLTCRV